MKPASTALITYLNDARANPDVPLLMADAFTFTLRSGLVLCYTNVDVTFSYNGNTYLGNSILVDGLKYKAAVGLEVDQQQITVAARSTDTITGGAPFLQALRDGSFDGCEIVRDRVFFSDRIGGTAIGSVTAVQGPARRHRRDRAHQRQAHRQFRSGAARHRHAAQRLSADLPAHALRFRLHAGEERLRHQRHGRRGLDGVDHQLVRRQRELPAGLDHVHIRASTPA